MAGESFAGKIVMLRDGNISNLEVGHLECDGYNNDYAEINFDHQGKTIKAKLLISNGDVGYECDFSSSEESAYKDLLKALANVQFNTVVTKDEFCVKPVVIIAVNEESNRFSNYTIDYAQASCE